jgi:hypothetical protein
MPVATDKLVFGTCGGLCQCCELAFRPLRNNLNSGGIIMVRFIFAVALLGLAVAGCGGSDQRTASTVTVHDTVAAATPPSTISRAPVAPSESSSAPSAAPDQSWTMPDLRGQNLQAAQDAIQALTNDKVFFSGSTDLTGQGRHQVLDRNWQVCTSTPAPGNAFTESTAIDFGVVRVDTESCP